MREIVPAILEIDFNSFSKQLKKMEQISNLVQIDIIDGFFLPNKTFDDIEKIKQLRPKCQFELHFMTLHPLQEMKKWSALKNIYRVIFHIEGKDELKNCIDYARGQNWQVGLALNPETPLDKAVPYYTLVDTIMFLTVNPGKQGGKFLPGIKEKIKKFTSLKNRPVCEVDGGIDKTNIRELLDIGAEIFSVGSALTQQKNPQKIYNELKILLN